MIEEEIAVDVVILVDYPATTLAFEIVEEIAGVTFP
jgi:hypothetical protein